MKSIYKWFVGVLLLGALTACDEQQIPDINEFMSSGQHSDISATEDFNVTDINFSNDYKEMYITLKLAKDIGGYDLSDTSQVYVTSSQEIQASFGRFIDSQPQLEKVDHIGKEEVSKLNLRILALIDLNLSLSQVNAQRQAVKEIKSLFGDYLYVAFMYGDNVSETYEATDYIIDNYFVPKNTSYTYLYRAILMKMDEMIQKTDSGSIFSKARYKAMVVMSDGKTYRGDDPIDPQHFELQQELTDRVQENTGKMQFYYAQFSDSIATANTDNANILQYMCKDLNGLYQDDFNWPAIEKNMIRDLNIDIADYKLTYINPDGKVFRGNRHNLNIVFSDRETNEKIASGSTHYALGSILDPIIVNGNSLFVVLLQGVLTTIFILLLVYLIMQLLVPYIMYRVFTKRYVTTYSGSNMSFNGEMVAETCYYCKTPFQEGDQIVAKCKHTMHKECWDENDYHCPEHGRHCKEGSHYYNRYDLLDKRNALFYMKWVIAAILAGMISWICFTILENPSMFGLIVSFFVTLFLSYLTVPRRQFHFRLLEMLVRSLCAGFWGYLCYRLGGLISFVLHLEAGSIIIGWIPWVLMTCFISLAVTVRTRIKIRRIFLLIACIIGILSMFLWILLYKDSVMDYRVSMLLSFIVLSVGIALCIARVAPKSERYFLHINGAIKEMDIALYKWMRIGSTNVVSIGKSVDCNIQLSWDINSQVAPLQAEIVRYPGSLRLRAVEEGVLVGTKPLPVDKEVWLYHGKSFTIGHTTFTYIEKDM